MPTSTMPIKPLPASTLKAELICVLDDFILYTLAQAPSDQSSDDSVQGTFYRQMIGLLEKQLLHHCLEACQYSRTKTAELLGMSRHTLRKKLDEHQIGIDNNPVVYGKKQNRNRERAARVERYA